MSNDEQIGDHKAESKTLLSNASYDALKNAVQLYLPGIGTLYFAIAAIWGLPYADEVVGTIAALAAFGGLFLKASSKSYEKDDSRFDGAVNLTSHDDEGYSDLHIQLDPVSLANKDVVVVKVNKA